MHIKLHAAFLELSDIEIRSHEALIDRILHEHLAQHHMFCLTPREVLRLRNAIQFGPLATRVLDTILRRSQDYLGSARSAGLHLKICPMGSVAPAQLGHEYYVSAEEMHRWLARAPVLFVENGINDGAVYRFIIQNGIKLVGASSNSVSIRTLHGGGNTLADVIEEYGGPLVQGMCIVDRDAVDHVPPFGHQTTGSRVVNTLVRLSVVNEDLTSTANPFFVLTPTFGWSLENYLGPNVMELFYDVFTERRAHRLPLLKAFPTFPILDEREYREWWGINFRSNEQDHLIMKQGLCSRLKIADTVEARCMQLAAVTAPPSLVEFVKQNSRSGRYHRDLLRAFTRDLKSTVYRTSIEQLCRLGLVALAADSQMSYV